MSLKNYLIRIIYAVFRLFPVDKRSVLCFSYYGEHNGGAPKYIADYLSDNSDFHVYRAFVSPREYVQLFPKHTLVHYGHISYYFELATAGIIITDYRMTEEFTKRKGQMYIQTWHSSLRLKMIENDAADVEWSLNSYTNTAKKRNVL